MINLSISEPKVSDIRVPLYEVYTTKRIYMEFKLIAEVGVNHLGSVDLAKKMIDAGVDAGVKYFKFQIFTVEELGEDETWAWYDYMNHCALSKEQHFELKDYCEKTGAVYFASVFGDWSLDVAEEMEMPIYKIASRSLYTKDGKISPLAEKIYALGKPAISSLGYYKDGWPVPMRYNNENLYCVSKYPTTREDISWPNFKAGLVNGFSDHSIGTELAKESIDLGATVIEKHFTIDKTLYGPDQKGSSLPAEMREIQEYGNNHLNSGL